MASSRKNMLLAVLLTVFLSVPLLIYGSNMFTSKTERQVGVFYYPWYLSDCDWYGKGKDAPAPSLGWYKSEDVVDQHLRWISEAGIDFLVVSWQGVNHGSNGVTDKIFSSVSSYGLKGCVLIETWFMNYSEFTDSVEYVWTQFAGRQEYFCLYGKPLLMVWSVDLTKTNIQNYSDERFTVRHCPTQVSYGYSASVMPQTLLGDFVTVLPGFDDTNFIHRKLPARIVSRRDGETYRNQWNLVLNLAETTPKNFVVVICSFNEWNELSSIEPSETWGTLYLDITKEYVHQFKQK